MLAVENVEKLLEAEKVDRLALVASFRISTDTEFSEHFSNSRVFVEYESFIRYVYKKSKVQANRRFSNAKNVYLAFGQLILLRIFSLEGT